MDSNKALQSAVLRYKLNEDIPLYNGRTKLFINDDEAEVEIEVYLKWLPNPSLRFKGTIANSESSFLNVKEKLLASKQKMVFPDNTTCDIFIQNITHGKEIFIEGTLRGYSSNEHRVVNNVTFSIINFLDYLGNPVEFENKGYLGRLVINYNEWRITIDKRHDYNQKPVKIMKQLKDQGGYLITHLGKIDRSDGKSFDTNEISHVIDSLHWLLSFASGRHIGISLMEGKYDEEVIWFDNNVPIISPWKNNLTWFPKQKAEVLEDLFSDVANCLQNEYLAKVLRESLSWYIECHSNSIIETKIVSAQTALEMLSWSYLVIYSKQLSKTQFKKKNTSENIRILLKKFEIETEYSFIPELQQLMFDDAVHLLTETRNDVVHPVSKQELDGNQKYMVLQIGVQYIELVLLGVFKYDKYYLNKLRQPIWEGNYDYVPWLEEIKRI